MRALLLCLVLGCTGCPPTPAPVTPESSGCADMCAHLESMQCESAQPTPNGASCVAVCVTVEQTSYTTMHPGCVLQAESCEEADRLSAEGCE